MIIGEHSDHKYVFTNSDLEFGDDFWLSETNFLNAPKYRLLS